MRTISSVAFATFVVAIFAAACVSTPSAMRDPGSPRASSAPSGSVGVSLDAVHPSPPNSPRRAPTAAVVAIIEHADGPTDVVLRFDVGPGDFGICELCGGWGFFTPGPEFTLYGDGTVIFRDLRGESPTAEGPISRDRPFRIGQLTEPDIQSLLQAAFDVGLAAARERYDVRTDTDDPSHSVFTIRAGGIDKRVEVFGPGGPFAALADQLLQFDPDDRLSTTVWAPDRYWGLLIEISPWIAIGVLDDVAAEGRLAWPWHGTDPWSEPWVGDRRVMSRDEAAVFGPLDDGGVVRHAFLVGPNGRTIYSYSQWPLLPDEMD